VNILLDNSRNNLNIKIQMQYDMILSFKNSLELNRKQRNEYLCEKIWKYQT
jgi:hypothetical protein